MPTARQVADPLGYIGPARTFLVDPPITDPNQGARPYNYVTVVLVDRYGPRVEVFGANADGTAKSMNPLPGSFILQRTVTLADACTWALLTAGGYEIGDPLVIEPDPEPEPEPEPEPVDPEPPTSSEVAGEEPTGPVALPFEVVTEPTPDTSADN